MQEFTTFDMVIIGITVVLGLKGLFRGFIKEVFGLVGIVGAIFVASRMSDTVGNILKPIVGLTNDATVSLVGFIATLIGFWLIVYILGTILSKVTQMSGLGAVDRLLGFLFGTGKIFLIISIIVYAIYQIESFKTTLDKKFGKSMVFPVLVSTGSYIIKLDTSKFMAKIDEKTKSEEPNKIVEEISKTVKETTSNSKESLIKTINEATTETINSAKQKASEIIKEEIQKTTEEIPKTVEDKK